MDDIVVIILTVLVAIIGVAGQRKKRRDLQEPGKTQPQSPVDFWGLLQEQGKIEDPYSEYGSVTEEEEEMIDTVPEQKPAYQFKTENEGSSGIVEQMKEKPSDKKSKVFIDGERFSLRKAVIYSEIMNRKYI